MRTQIDLGAVSCGTGLPDADGVTWTCGFPDGWDSPSQRGGTLEATGRDGSVALANFLSGRELVVKGMCRATTDEGAWLAFYRIMSDLPGLRGSMDLVVHEPIPKFLTVMQHGQPRADAPRSGIRQFFWQLSLRADMPLKRALTENAQELTSGGSASLVNGGRAAAYPTATVTSAGTVDLTIGTRHFTTTDLPVGAVVDMWARTITAVDGSSLYGAKDPASEWLALPPGSTLTGQAGTAGLDLTWHDTYP